MAGVTTFMINLPEHNYRLRDFVGASVLRLAISIVALWFVVCQAAQDGPIWLDAKINGKPAKICFDSGGR